MIKYDEAAWGIPKKTFMDALIAEGVDATYGYIAPLYKNPMFLNQDFYRHSKCPVDCMHYGKQLNYADFEAKCPVSEQACKEAI
jgi:hypothetical protein